MTSPSHVRTKAAASAFLLVVAAYLFATAMAKNLNHDEHQFVAPAVLLAEDGLQPYRDFPLFHLPNLVFLYAHLFRAFGHPLLTARCFSVLSAFATIWLIFGQCGRSPPFGMTRWRFLFAAAAVLLLVFDPLFEFTTGRAWNHDSSAFFIICATTLQVSAARKDSVSLVVSSAVCASFAVGIRLTCAPLLVPLWLSVWFFPVPPRRRILLAATYLGAGTAALVPSLFYLLRHTEPFIFGNFEFPRLRLLDPDNERIRKTISPLRKLRFFCKEVALPSWPLFLAFLALATAPGIAFFRDRSAKFFGPALVLSLLPFALLGCLTPSRYQYQHFFIFIPLLVLGTAMAAATLGKPRKWLTALLAFSALSSLTRFVYNLPDRTWLLPRDWFPNRIQRVGEKISTLAPVGPILTLAPIYPIEAGLPIYPEFASGPFAWKSAPFVAVERRPLFHLIAPADLEILLARRKPAAILTGVEDSALEQPLVEYGRVHRFTPINLGKERTLWLTPRL